MQCRLDKSAIDIDQRRTELSRLSSYIKAVDNDVTMILQSLQWDRKHLIEASPMVQCKHDRNHRVPPDKLRDHERNCYLRSLGYSEDDLLLPDPLDTSSNTLVKLSKNDIQNIIEYAAKVDPAFKKAKGRGTRKDPSEPLSLARLQHAYSADERRALHDAAVSAAPASHDLSQLQSLGGDTESQTTKPKSRVEILAELRDMKRRRAKYRGAANTRNYSDELRTVIAAQMEHYTEALGIKTTNDCDNNQANVERATHNTIEIKKEPIDSDETDKGTRRNLSNESDRRRDKTRGETRNRDKIKDEFRYRHKSQDGIHDKDIYNNDRRPRDKSRDKCKERERLYDDYIRGKGDRRDKEDRRHENDRDRYLSSSRDRSRDRKDYRNSDKYRDDSRRHEDYRSRNSEVRYKDRHDSRDKCREERHKRYYDYVNEYEVDKNRIKKEKD